MKHFNLAFLFVFLFPLSSSYAGPSKQDFSHQLFQRVVAQYVDDGAVDYLSINNSADYHSYISMLAKKTDFQNNIIELSYWINAYNALAIKGILDGRSPESFFGKIGYFYNAEYTVNNITINLYNLEHDIIIPLGEPRIHFALNCASASCPKLRNTIYRADKLEQQLEQAATDFINDKTRNQFNLKTKTAYISKIFDWFESDFEKHSGSVQNYLALYIKDGDISNALASNEFNIEYMEYDWSLNGTPPKHDESNND